MAVAMCFMAFIALSTFPGWLEMDDDESGGMFKAFPSRSVSHFSLLASILGFGFGFISVLWQHINSSSTATMAEVLTYGAVKGHVGRASMALGWISVFVLSLVSVGILVMIKSISLIRRLTECSE